MRRSDSKPHKAAVEAITLLMDTAQEQGFKTGETLYAIETIITIGICYLASTEAKGYERRFGQESVDLMTKNAYERILAFSQSGKIK